MNASASTAMKYRPAQPGDEAGITAFQNDDFNYQLGVRLEGGQTVVRLVKHSGRGTPAGGDVIATAPLTLPASETIYLRIDARADKYAFYYGTSPGQWTLLKDGVDGTILSTRVAGGFVGTMLGLYAVSGGNLIQWQVSRCCDVSLSTTSVPPPARQRPPRCLPPAPATRPRVRRSRAARKTRRRSSVSRSTRCRAR
jgi:hypothetical protein